MKCLKLMLIGTALLSMTACSNKGSEEVTANPDMNVYEKAVTWDDVKTDFIAKEAELQAAEAEGYVISEEETKTAIKAIADGYQKFYSSFSDTDLMLSVYENARKLETSANDEYIKLAQATEEFLFTVLGFYGDGSNSLDAQYNFYSQLLAYEDELNMQFYVPNGYEENIELTENMDEAQAQQQETIDEFYQNSAVDTETPVETETLVNSEAPLETPITSETEDAKIETVE